MARRVTASPEETLALGQQLGQKLHAPAIVALFGELGAGKTTFAKGLVSQLAGLTPDEVTSPTFVCLQVYPPGIFHFDLYRLKGSEEFLERGFEEQLDEGIVVIEWAERIEKLLPPNTLRITLHHAGKDRREITSGDPL